MHFRRHFESGSNWRAVEMTQPFGNHFGLRRREIKREKNSGGAGTIRDAERLCQHDRISLSDCLLILPFSVPGSPPLEDNHFHAHWHIHFAEFIKHDRFGLLLIEAA